MAEPRRVNHPVSSEHLPPSPPQKLPSGQNLPSVSSNGLPEIGMITVADIQVDMRYQHQFYPGAVESLKANFQPKHSGFILVSIREDGSIWAIDGYTRRTVSQDLGIKQIPAEIKRGLTLEQEAEIYLLRAMNIQRQQVDIFQAELQAKKPVALLLEKKLQERKIVVQSYATRTNPDEDKTVMSCVATLKRILRSDPDADRLGATLDLIFQTWGYDKSTVAGSFVEMIYGLLRSFDEVIDRKRFIAKLSNVRLEDLRERARAKRYASRPEISLRRAMQQTIAEIYNANLPEGKRISLES